MAQPSKPVRPLRTGLSGEQRAEALTQQAQRALDKKNDAAALRCLMQALKKDPLYTVVVKNSLSAFLVKK